MLKRSITAATSIGHRFGKTPHLMFNSFWKKLINPNEFSLAVVNHQPARSLVTTCHLWSKPNKETTPNPSVTTLKPVKSDTKILESVDKLVNQGHEGRLFAVVHLCGKQFKITDGDIILVEGYWPPTIGDKIRLDKVLLVGGKDFSLIGTPILQPGIVDIQATIVEKSLTHTKTNFKKKKTKQYMRINFIRNQVTMIRINSIEIKKSVRDTPAPATDDLRVF